MRNALCGGGGQDGQGFLRSPERRLDFFSEWPSPRGLGAPAPRGLGARGRRLDLRFWMVGCRHLRGRNPRR